MSDLEQKFDKLMTAIEKLTAQVHSLHEDVHKIRKALDIDVRQATIKCGTICEDLIRKIFSQVWPQAAPETDPISKLIRALSKNKIMDKRVQDSCMKIMALRNRAAHDSEQMLHLTDLIDQVAEMNSFLEWYCDSIVGQDLRPQESTPLGITVRPDYIPAPNIRWEEGGPILNRTSVLLQSDVNSGDFVVTETLTTKFQGLSLPADDYKTPLTARMAYDSLKVSMSRFSREAKLVYVIDGACRLYRDKMTSIFYPRFYRWLFVYTEGERLIVAAVQAEGVITTFVSWADPAHEFHAFNPIRIDRWVMDSDEAVSLVSATGGIAKPGSLILFSDESHGRQILNWRVNFGATFIVDATVDVSDSRAIVQNPGLELIQNNTAKTLRREDGNFVVMRYHTQYAEPVNASFYQDQELYTRCILRLQRVGQPWHIDFFYTDQVAQMFGIPYRGRAVDAKGGTILSEATAKNPYQAIYGQPVQIEEKHYGRSLLWPWKRNLVFETRYEVKGAIGIRKKEYVVAGKRKAEYFPFWPLSAIT